MSRTQTIVMLVLIVVLGTVLRLYELGEKSLWTDELATMSNAAGIVDVESFFAHTRGDDLPKFHALFVKGWMRVAESEFWLRFPSVVFGSLAILAAYFLGRLFFDQRVSLVAALLTALSPFLLLYDRELRGYSLFTLFSLLASYTFIRAIRDNSRRLWVFYTVVTILNVYTHYYAFLTIAVQWLFLAIHRRRYWPVLRPWLIANATVAVVFALRLPALIADVLYFAPWAIPRERFPFVYARQLVEFGYTLVSFAASQTILPWNPVAVLLAAAVLACAVIGARAARAETPDWTYLVLLVLLPLTIGVVFRIGLPRYFTFLAPVFFLLAAAGWWRLRRPAIAAAAAVVVIAGWGYGAANYYRDREFHIMAHTDPWRSVGEFLRQNVRSGDGLYVIGLGVVPLRHYYQTDLAGYSSSDAEKKISEVRAAGTDRMWVVQTSQDEYSGWLKVRTRLRSLGYEVDQEAKWAQDPDFELKRRLFRRDFAPYRIVAELYTDRSGE